MTQAETGEIVYRASSLGGCPVALARLRQGMTPMEAPAKFLEYFERGNRVEEEVKADLREKGWVITEEQAEVDLWVGTKIVVRGHIDGIGGTPIAHDVLRLLEIKSTTTSYFKSLQKHGWDTPGLLQKYKWQISVYLMALREELDNPRLEGALIFRNHEDDDPNTNTLWLFFEKPPWTRNEIFARVLMVESWVKAWEVPDTCDVYDYPCPFYYMHPPEVRETVDDEEESLAIEVAARAYDDAGSREREAKADKQRAATTLRGLVGEREKLTAGGATVTRYVGKHSVVDRGRLAADFPSLNLDDYTDSVPNATSSFRVSIEADADDAAAGLEGDGGGVGDA